MTDGDLEIVSLLARHRFLRSTHIAALVGRSLDRVNDRLLRLFHAGYVDRPRAQLNRYPDCGSTPMVYALADRGARLLAEQDGSSFSKADWSRKNDTVGHPFIEHQLEITDFYVALQRAAAHRDDLKLIHPDELMVEFPNRAFNKRNPFALRTKISHQGAIREIGIVPDLAFGLRFKDGSRRCFMVEIDRGTMPVSRSNLVQTSFERKMRAYLMVHATEQYRLHFGWKTFRVLTVTTNQYRIDSMIDVLHTLRIPHSPGPQLFFFAIRNDLCVAGPLVCAWRDGNGRNVLPRDFMA